MKSTQSTRRQNMYYAFLSFPDASPLPSNIWQAEKRTCCGKISFVAIHRDQLFLTCCSYTTVCIVALILRMGFYVVNTACTSIRLLPGLDDAILSFIQHVLSSGRTSHPLMQQTPVTMELSRFKLHRSNLPKSEINGSTTFCNLRNRNAFQNLEKFE